MKRKEAMDIAKYSDDSSIRRGTFLHMGVGVKKWSQVTVLSNEMSYTCYD
jgi:hypothetical protein